MRRLLGLGLAALALACGAQPRLAERPLDDLAVIAVPAALERQGQGGYESELLHRRAYLFGSRFLWASWGSVTRYRQLLAVSLLADDIADGDAAVPPRAMDVSYERRQPRRSRPLGPGTLTVTEGWYELGADGEPAVMLLYLDRARGLQIAWHLVKKEMDTEVAVAQIERMAASYRRTGDVQAAFARERASRVQARALQARNVDAARALWQRLGLGPMVPGRPVAYRGVYVEWMSDPEPRLQLLLPLGRVRAAPAGQVARRPRPLRGADALPGIGWREHGDEGWRWDNAEHAYLPFPGIAALLAERQQDRGWVYFFHATTLRVEEEPDDRLLKSLDWYVDGVPELRRRWQAGTLVGPGRPED